MKGVAQIAITTKEANKITAKSLFFIMSFNPSQLKKLLFGKIHYLELWWFDWNGKKARNLYLIKRRKMWSMEGEGFSIRAETARYSNPRKPLLLDFLLREPLATLFLKSSPYDRSWPIFQANPKAYSTPCQNNWPDSGTPPRWGLRFFVRSYIIIFLYEI